MYVKNYKKFILETKRVMTTVCIGITSVIKVVRAKGVT